MQTASQYRLISIGIVAENKQRNSREIEVMLIEKSPFLNGELVGGYEEDSVTGQTPTGASISVSVKTSNTITATWKGDASNRVSAPDVRRGDKVEVLQYGDTDKYVWRVYNDPSNTTRRRETVIEAFSNTSDEATKELTPENAWYRETNTHDKVATLLRTNKSDGEKYAYDATIDVAKGAGQIMDDTGNGWRMDSNEKLSGIENSVGSYVRVVGDTVYIKGKRIVMIADHGDVQIPTTNWKGSINLSGNMTGGGGTYTFNGNVITNNDIFNKGKNIGSTHTHKGVRGGSDNSGDVN